MDNVKNADKPRTEFPQLKYYRGWLVVDRAWVDAKRRMVLVEIEGQYFEMDIDTAVQSEWGLNQCELIPVDHGPTETDWPLRKEDCRRFRFMLPAQIPALDPKPLVKFVGDDRTEVRFLHPTTRQLITVDDYEWRRNEALLGLYREVF